MTGLLDAVLAAHGGLGRWRQFSAIEATIVSGGKLWEIKGQPQDPTPRRTTVALQRERASVQPFGASDERLFTLERVAIERFDAGKSLNEVTRASSRSRVDKPMGSMGAPYFNGYVLWTYLTTRSS